jgi:hypothetical protein
MDTWYLLEIAYLALPFFLMYNISYLAESMRKILPKLLHWKSILGFLCSIICPPSFFIYHS